MHQRALGRSGLTVSEIGLGCNRLGEPITGNPDFPGEANHEFWVQLVQRAVALGVTLYDTSESYQWGGSEELLGLALGNRLDVVIASKISRERQTDHSDFSALRIISQCEGSLKRLRRERIEIYQLHSPGRADLERFDWAEGMAKLRFQGKILLRAVAVRSAEDGIWLIQQGLVDVLQVTYNLLEREAAASGLLALAEAEGIGILGRMPMAQGILSGKFKPGDTVPPGHRAHLAGSLLAERIQKAEIYRALGEHYPGGMVRMALHFALTPPGMSAIIPGARHQAQLEGNITASNGRGLDEFWQKQLEGL